MLHKISDPQTKDGDFVVIIADHKGKPIVIRKTRSKDIEPFERLGWTLNVCYQASSLLFVLEQTLCLGNRPTMRVYIIQKILRPLVVVNWPKPLVRRSDTNPSECLCHASGAGFMLESSLGKCCRICKS